MCGALLLWGVVVASSSMGKKKGKGKERKVMLRLCGMERGTLRAEMKAQPTPRSKRISLLLPPVYDIPPCIHLLFCVWLLGFRAGVCVCGLDEWVEYLCMCDVYV